MERNCKNYFLLFKSTFLLSACTFGGGYVIVSLMKKKFVDELGWLEEREMLDMVAIAQSSPGAMAVNASVLLGWRLLGWPGVLLAIVGTVLPPFIILSTVSVFYAALRDNAVVSAVLKGLMAGVCAVIFDVVISLGAGLLRAKKLFPILIMAAAFLAHYVFHTNMIYIILACGALGALAGLRARRPEGS